MAASLDLSKIRWSIKKESGPGVAASGSGATVMQPLAGQGFQDQLKTVLTELLDTTRMAGRPRQGSRFYTIPFDFELTVGAHELQMLGALGATAFTSAIALSNTDLTSAVISGTGTTITFGGGSLITLGAFAGGMLTFTNLATTANDSIPVPISAIDATGRIVTIPSGYLVDETIDSTFNVTIARQVSTPDPYVDSTYTLEAYLQGIASPRSLQGVGFRFNSFGIDIQPNKKTKLSVGLGGTDVSMLVNGSSPFFTTPTLVQGESLYMIDGGIYVGGVKRVNLSSLNIKLEAPVSGIDLIGSNVSPDAFLGQFKMTGQMTGTIADGTDYDNYKSETVAQIILHCKEQNTTNFVTIAVNNVAPGGWSMPGAGEGPAIQTVPLYGGKDKRGVLLGYPASTLLVSST